MFTTATAWALNRAVQHCQLHWASRTIIRALSHSVLLVGMELQSMECVIIQSTVPDRWMITASITLPPQITLRWMPLERGFTHSHFGSVSGFGLGESHFLLSYICFWDFVWHQILDILCINKYVNKPKAHLQGWLASYPSKAWRPWPSFPSQMSSQAAANQVHFRRRISKFFLIGFFQRKTEQLFLKEQ